jgi:short-subunit dehydrogenase
MSDKPICIVVGVGGGIGMSVAQRFAREGYVLGLIARKAESLENYAKEIRATGADVYTTSADASNTNSLRSALDQIVEQAGILRVLVYNVAALREVPASQLTHEEVLNDFQVNVASPLIAAQWAIPQMKALGGGTILFTGGGLALNPRFQYASLALDKAALRNLTFSLGAELKSDNIHVATVTVAGYVQRGTHFDPDLIAEEYWKLHSQSPDTWEHEIIYQ